MLRKVIAISGKCADYIDESQASHKLGFPAYRIAPAGMRNAVYWKEDSSSEGNDTSIKGDRGIQGKRGDTGGAGPIGPHGQE